MPNEPVGYLIFLTTQYDLPGLPMEEGSRVGALILDAACAPAARQQHEEFAPWPVTEEDLEALRETEGWNHGCPTDEDGRQTLRLLSVAEYESWRAEQARGQQRIKTPVGPWSEVRITRRGWVLIGRRFDDYPGSGASARDAVMSFVNSNAEDESDQRPCSNLPCSGVPESGRMTVAALRASYLLGLLVEISSRETLARHLPAELTRAVIDLTREHLTTWEREGGDADKLREAVADFDASEAAIGA